VLRHEFRPGKLVAGVFLTAAGVVYIGDAGDAWETPWFVVIPLVVAGLCLAGVVASLNHAIRGRRAPKRTGQVGAPGPTRSAGSEGPEAGWAGSAGQTGGAGSAGPSGQAGSAGQAGHAGSS
jgi:hypothetical protein